MIIFKAKQISVKQQLTRLRLVFSTKDGLDPLVVAQMTKTDGWLAFNEDQFKAEVEKAMADRKIGVNTEGKSHSQVFRGILYDIWTQTAEQILWDDYYHREMTRIENYYTMKYLNRADPGYNL